MANRFTDTDKWKKPWFRKLSPIDKCFWQYLTDNCNHAGIWEVDFELAEVFIGAELDIEEIKKIFAKQYIELSQGKKWLIIDFVPFQYKKGLNPENRAHASVIAILKKEGAYKGLTRGLQARKDKDKDKDIVKDKVKDKNKDKDRDFETIWAKYPKKIGKKEALRHFQSSVKTQDDWVNICKALGNYLASERVSKGYIQNASTWFGNWTDWVDYTEPICKKCKNKGEFDNERGYREICDCPAGKRLEKEQ